MTVPIAKPYFDGDEEAAVVEALRSGWVSHGPRTIEFEARIAEAVGVRFGRAVNSGTSALHLALLACGIGAGDEVIVPAFTCVATLNPLEHLGARPVPVDIELETFGLDPAKLAAAVTPRTRAVIVVHLFGLAARVPETLERLPRGNIAVIEDIALGLGAGIGERAAGSFGDAAFISFHPRKTITTGEGGMVLTNSEEIATQVGELRNYGASVSALDRHRRRLYDLPEYRTAGFNYKMTDIQAAVGLVQARKLAGIIRMRRAIAAQYDEAFADLEWLRRPGAPRAHLHTYQSYACLLPPAYGGGPAHAQRRQRAFFEHLSSRGVASVQGAQAMPLIAYYRERYNWPPDAYPNALLADRGSVCLPLFPGMADEQRAGVIDAVRSFVP